MNEQASYLGTYRVGSLRVYAVMFSRDYGFIGPLDAGYSFDQKQQ